MTHGSIRPGSRRSFLRTSVALAGAGTLAVGPFRPDSVVDAVVADETPSPPGEATDIGSRRELFVDTALVDKLLDKAELRLHEPVPREVVLVHDSPWEGSGSGYHSIFQDGPLYRMYYKAWHLDFSTGKLRTDRHPLYCCYAESDDGIHWRKPELGLHEFNGSKANNIVINSGKVNGLTVDAGHPAVFKDENPSAPAEARYKAIVRSADAKGLIPLGSPDGIHWTLLSDHPVITDGAFDSQNLAFWDSSRGEYRAYWRYFTAGTTDPDNWKPKGHRAIRTATSKDFLTWTNQADLTYENSPNEHLYTNQIKPYHRAPHLLIGFPARYIDRGWSETMRGLPEKDHREMRSAATERYGTAITDSLVMASRNGVHFHRWNEAFLRPGIERPGTWHYGQQYLAWHLVETPSALEGAPPELSLYATESYWTDTSSALRRYTLRLDGFVSVRAPMSGGQLITKPVRFQGARLALNFSTSAAGDVRVELQDASGNPLPGFTLEDCIPLFGDSTQRTVMWKSGANVESLAGKPIRLRFALRDADLYAYDFGANPVPPT